MMTSVRSTMARENRDFMRRQTLKSHVSQSNRNDRNITDLANLMGLLPKTKDGRARHPSPPRVISPETASISKSFAARVERDCLKILPNVAAGMIDRSVGKPDARRFLAPRSAIVVVIVI